MTGGDRIRLRGVDPLSTRPATGEDALDLVVMRPDPGDLDLVGGVAESDDLRAEVEQFTIVAGNGGHRVGDDSGGGGEE